MTGFWDSMLGRLPSAVTGPSRNALSRARAGRIPTGPPIASSAP